MDFKPIPPDGKVHDLRNAQKPKTEQEIKDEKQAKNDKVRRNLRIVALVLACYYFASAGYSWYQESQHEQNATTATNLQNPLKDPVLFRQTFNTLINEQDTSLPTANANDTPEGFVAVLSTSVEMQGMAKPNSKELQSVQIQTRYPDAFPPESLKAFKTFILANERLYNSEADMALVDEVLNNLGIIPKFDANEDNKVFAPTTVQTDGYQYQTTFTSGPIDELTLVVTPRINLSSFVKDDATASQSAQAPATNSQAATQAAPQANSQEQSALNAVAEQDTAQEQQATIDAQQNSELQKELEQNAPVESDVPVL